MDSRLRGNDGSGSAFSPPGIIPAVDQDDRPPPRPPSTRHGRRRPTMHDFPPPARAATWMAGPSPAMTAGAAGASMLSTAGQCLTLNSEQSGQASDRPQSVIARSEATRQSMVSHERKPELLRSARNDGALMMVCRSPMCFTRLPRLELAFAWPLQAIPTDPSDDRFGCLRPGRCRAGDGDKPT